ncbi:TetR/AcrR family transcriptional regulator [Leucobacter muris]|uniref:TetR/AcrR family transcriptional regulator n=1 Tax=Leucobacter muris TaxID=1935379 RepID=A0ABX5QFW7_9MICO|nr:TetR/AcrR family transcriptional regulator [Leucobacter muris]QAB17930.1 TetR/AcrR family transcriptional regulator [Leucobacter muris]
MSTTHRRTRRRPGENRERLLEAGLVEFGLFGYHGASTSSIAARADVPQPHVYANFETKQQLFLACFERLGEQLSVRPSEAPSESLLRFLYQSVASSAAPGLQKPMRRPLLELRALLGEPLFDALLAAGARALLDAQPDPRP